MYIIYIYNLKPKPGRSCSSHTKPSRPSRTFTPSPRTSRPSGGGSTAGGASSKYSGRTTPRQRTSRTATRRDPPPRRNSASSTTPNGTPSLNPEYLECRICATSARQLADRNPI